MDDRERQNDSDLEQSSLMDGIDTLEELLPDELLEIPTNCPGTSTNNTTTTVGPLIPDSATIFEGENEVNNFVSTTTVPMSVGQVGGLEPQITISSYSNSIQTPNSSSTQENEHPISLTNFCPHPPSFAISSSSHENPSSNQVYLEAPFALLYHGKDMRSNKVSSSHRSHLPLVDTSNFHPARTSGNQNFGQSYSTSMPSFGQTWDLIKASSFHQNHPSTGNSSVHHSETSFGDLKKDQNLSVMTANTDMNTASGLPTVCDQPTLRYSTQGNGCQHSSTSTTLATQFRESRSQSYTPTVLKPVSEVDINGKKFCESDNLESHLTPNVNERPFECIVCHMKFWLKSSLKRHTPIHTVVREILECDRCDKKFTFYSRLEAHYRVHTGEKPFECDQCDQKFAKNNQLKVHYRVHTGERPYECDKCDKKFKTKGHLRSHYNFHADEKPWFKCDICGKEFKWRGNLRRHYKNHTGEEPFKCNKCGKIFSNRENWKQHYITRIREKTCNL